MSRSNVKGWFKEPFVWVLLFYVLITAAFVFLLVLVGVYQFSLLAKDAADFTICMRVLQCLVGMYLGLFIVIIGAFWAWYDIKHGQVMVAKGEIKAKFVGIASVLVVCGTLVLISSIFKEIKSEKTDMHVSPRNQTIMTHPGNPEVYHIPDGPQ